MPDDPCPFCYPSPGRIAFETRLVRALWDAFPVSEGHLLLVPRRHVPSWFEATAEERQVLTEALDQAKTLIEERHHPDGFNIGINVGEAAGQTVPHLHVHLIPRSKGDVPDPTGGVRHVIPGKANYKKAEGEAGPPTTSRLVTGGEHDPLFPYLTEELTRCKSADIAVGFAMRSGVARVQDHFADFLENKGRLRLVTGDYLGVTDPDALTRLLDLGGDRHIRIFETQATPGPAWPGPIAPLVFHPKAYVFRRADGTGVAFIGSSNLSESALMTGIEWSYRTVESGEADAFNRIEGAFQALFAHPATKELTPEWIARYRERRPAMQRTSRAPVPAEIEVEPRQVVTPHEVQQRALEALQETRKKGNTAGLVVMATGLGKTWLAAFDSNRKEFQRVLFVAHREEILNQSLRTFRAILPEARLGLYTATTRDRDKDVVFASIQTISRTAHLDRFPKDAFDYVVVDEFHHAAAPTYRRLISHFRPKFLLGLTATPERTDGGDLLALCQENLVFRCDLIEGIRRDLLCRFRYFGVPDDVDYTNIPWRNSRFDEEALTNHVATQARAKNALDQLQKRGGTRTLAFCVSQRHADFMADYFNKQQIRAVAVHSGETSAPRAKSLEELQAGHLQVICAVDIFNEGLDLPELDTVLMLRPTESRILWLQQFGRGLRKTKDDKQLTVIDYIGNHRTFLLKPQTLFNLGTGAQEILNLLQQAQQGPIEIAPGCYVTYELETIDILRSLARVAVNRQDALKRYYEEFLELHGTRPTAAETFHEGYNPRSMRRDHGSWLGFVKSQAGLDENQSRTFDRHRPFLESLEATEMTRSYKMLLLQAMLNEDTFPGQIEITKLAQSVKEIAERNPHLKADLGDRADQEDTLRRLLEENPINAWTRGRGTGGTPYFAYDNAVFRTTLTVDPADRDPLQELTRELVDWRLAEYLLRPNPTGSEGNTFVCKVSHAGPNPIIFLHRDKNPGLPEGPTTLDIDGNPHEADFTKIALNVVREPGNPRNVLPQLLRTWFGPDAGRPGTRHEVIFTESDSRWTLRSSSPPKDRPQLWHRYSREQIPALFGLPFSTAIWNSGFVVRKDHIFLLVTLDKSGKSKDFQYRDHFISPNLFQWESQNRTRQSDTHGQLIQTHRVRNVPVHLFVRKTSKIPGGRSAPFAYCGDVEFVDWEGEKPITVRWRLPEPAPERLMSELGITGA